jgi:hypothetical protein
MDKWLNKIDQLDPNNLFGWIVAASILLAAWMQYIQHGWINPDSVLYFEQARLFSLGDLHGVVNVFNWPLYGICIGIIHKLTPLSIHVSAQLLNMLFFGMAVASFLQLIKLAGGCNRTLVAGALLLFGSQYIVGDVLEMLLRDIGFWAFYLTALVFFIRYDQRLRLHDAVLWQICIMFATLFRIEAILFLLLLPLIYLFGKPKPTVWRFKKVFHIYSLSILATIIIGVTLATQPQLSMAQFGRLQEIFTLNLYQEFTQQIFTKADIMSNQVLGKYLEEFAIPGLLLTFLYVMGSKIITATGLIGSGLAALGLKHQCLKQVSPTMQPAVSRILIAISVVALISMALIITKVFVLSSRYVVALAWVLFIFAAFYLAALSSSQHKKTHIYFIIICLLLCLGLIKNILPKRAGYNYQQEAVAWLKKNNLENQPVFYNDSRSRYYAKEAFDESYEKDWLIITQDPSIQEYNFLVIKVGRPHLEQKEKLIDGLPKHRLIKEFKNTKDSKRMLIFSTNHKPPND